jgi:hypothetical protein
MVTFGTISTKRISIFYLLLWLLFSNNVSAKSIKKSSLKYLSVLEKVNNVKKCYSNPVSFNDCLTKSDTKLKCTEANIDLFISESKTKKSLLSFLCRFTQYNEIKADLLLNGDEPFYGRSSEYAKYIENFRSKINKRFSNSPIKLSKKDTMQSKGGENKFYIIDANFGSIRIHCSNNWFREIDIEYN